jgi:hypothetical protein
MMERWHPGILGGTLSFSIHSFLLGLATLVALSDALPELPSSDGPGVEPFKVVLQRDTRDRYRIDRDGTLTGPRSSLRSQRGLRFPLPIDFSAASSESLAPALSWLVRHQNEDGSWSVDRFDRHCDGARCDGSGGSRCDWWSWPFRRRVRRLGPTRSAWIPWS